MANITFFDSMACEILLQLNAIHILLQACKDRQRVDTPYSKDQVVTILANLSVLEQCASEVLQEQGKIFFTFNDICYFFCANLQLTLHTRNNRTTC
ncbi:hypothetical protein INR49_017511 [Caranx melampygus]|nr:hypothetical protein INR49_017511 [Caranx melampygus]